MKIKDLKAGYSIFGGKGNVWGNSCHISRDNDQTGRTLCGVPMLSSNWARIDNVEEIGCPDCLNEYEISKDAPIMGSLDANGDTI